MHRRDDFGGDDVAGRNCGLLVVVVPTRGCERDHNIQSFLRWNVLEMLELPPHLRSDLLVGVASLDVGRYPSWSKPTCTFTAPFVRRNFAHGNADRHKSMVVESTENNLALNL